MRARMYDFLWIIIGTPLVLLWAATGGAGFLFAALVLITVVLRSFCFVLQIGTYSDKIITDSLANSTDGNYFDTCDAIGTKPYVIEAQKMKDNKPLAIQVSAYPAVNFYELGTGEWGLAKKWGGNEHGFLICNKDLVLQLSDGGNIVCLGPVVTYRPIHRGMLQLLRQVKPTEPDSRSVLPPEWWTKLRAHPRFNIRKSCVHVCLDPLFPIIKTARMAKQAETILMLPGSDAVEGSHPMIPPLEFRLSDIVGPNSPILDMRPEMRMGRDQELVTLRETMGEKVNTLMEINQFLREELAASNAIAEMITPQEMMKEKLITTVAGSEQTGERSQR